MRTTLRKIRGALRRSWNDIEVSYGSGANTLFLTFLDDNVQCRTFIVYLCENAECMTAPGVHVKVTKTFKKDLINAVERAIKNDFDLIFAHQSA